MKITEHFTLEELTRTSRAQLQAENLQYGQDNITTLYALCARILEPVRTLLGVPLVISSAIRCPALNEAVGGSILSQHLKGEAADFVPRGMSVLQAWQKISAAKDTIPFGQVVYEVSEEGKEWIHISLGGEPWRPPEKSGQVLVIDKRRP